MISYARVISPLIRPVELFDETFRQQSLQIAKEDNIIFAMEVYPTAVAVPRILTLCLTRLIAVEKIIKRFVMDIAQHDI